MRCATCLAVSVCVFVGVFAFAWQLRSLRDRVRLDSESALHLQRVHYMRSPGKGARVGVYNGLIT